MPQHNLFPPVESSSDLDWWENQQNLPAMSQFERTLQCPICKEIMDNPKCIKTCNHFFCDLCISREFSFRNKCPVCKEEYSKSDIIKIPFVTDMIDLYIKARKDLVGKIGQESSQPTEDQKSIISESQESFDWSEQLNKNIHEQPFIQKNKLPPLCFSLLKNNQLKDYLKKYSLPLHGTREQMIWRIKEYILRYNSNIDRTNPASEEKIINSIVKEEKEREQLKMKNVAPNLTFFSIPKRKSDSTTINIVNSSHSSDGSEGGLDSLKPRKAENTQDSSIHTIVLSPDDTNIIILTPPLKEREEKSEFVDNESPNKNKRRQEDDDTPTKWKKRCTVKIKTPLSKQSNLSSLELEGLRLE